MKRIAITGSSGYLGSSLIRYFAAHEPEVKILGLDIVPPRDPGGHEFLQLDMCRPEFAAALKIFQPDTVVHMAFVVPPMHDERKMRAINLEGSRNVLEATAAAGAERLLVTSSATALGAWPDNPVPLDDSWPGRAGPQFSYAAHKVELEAMLVQFAEEHPQIAVSCVRPCIVGGPHMDNYLRHLLFEMPIIVLLDRRRFGDSIGARGRRLGGDPPDSGSPGNGGLQSRPARHPLPHGDRRADRPAADQCAVLAGTALGLDGVEDAFSAPQVSAGIPLLSPLSLARGLQPVGSRVGISVSAFKP